MFDIFKNIDFTFTSAVDIIFVAIFIYYILIPMKGTRSARIAIGIFFIILFYFISDRFNLQTMAWILQNFLAYIVFAIIVIFQDDIRKALATFGRNPFLDFLRIREKPLTSLTELQRGVTLLAKKNTGALIVIDRSHELKSLIDSGTAIDAVITAELLQSIFNTRGPIHDGAVIISHGRIACAGVILPLSSRSNISGELGTRHRAAIGMTEQSNAVVVVVSEERGSVSLAVNGWLDRLSNPHELEKKLNAIFESE